MYEAWSTQLDSLRVPACYTKLDFRVGRGRRVPGVVSEDSCKKWKKGKSNPGIWHWVLTASMSQPQVPRDRQCSQHCWVCAVVFWPWSFSVMLSECHSCKSGLGSFSEKQPPQCEVMVQPGSGREVGRTLCIWR